MTIEIVTPPAIEPVSVDEAKLRLRIDHDDEDAMLGDLIAATRERVERLLGQALITRRVREVRDGWRLGGEPCPSVIRLALGPVSQLHEISTVDASGAEALAPLSDFILDAASVPGRIALADGASWPPTGQVIMAVAIEYDAGYGGDPADCPGPLREAILALVAESYVYRTGAERGAVSEEIALPATVSGLLSSYRRVRL